jgi:hypothetical protein
MLWWSGSAFTAKANLAITVKCENCANAYSYDLAESASVADQGKSLEEFDAERESRNKLNARIAQRSAIADFGVSRCPTCKHLQSWMRNSQRKDFWNGICGLSLMLTILGGVVAV